MTILYLHGLMSSNQSNKIDWLKENHDVINPLIKYSAGSKSLFSDLKVLCEQNAVDLIIGSSMGGFLGFHLSNTLNIPSLLFNPALVTKSEFKPQVTAVNNTSVLHTIIFGRNDDVVIPGETLQFLKDNYFNFTHSYEQTGHRTPFPIFKKHVALLQLSENPL